MARDTAEDTQTVLGALGRPMPSLTAVLPNTAIAC